MTAISDPRRRPITMSIVVDRDPPSPASTGAPSAQPPLAASSLTYVYPGADQPAVDRVDCSLARGRVTVLLGPNASGKSTLLKLLLGQLRPTAGAVSLMGRPMARWSAARRAALLSYVPQQPLISFAYSVRQVVEMGRFARTPDAAAVDHAMQRCGVHTLADRPATALSAGQQQRVVLARALAQAAPDRPTAGSDPGDQPAVMLLDEPSSAMDLSHAHETMALLRKQAEAGLAVLVVLHDLNLAIAAADDVLLMDAGRIVAAGPWSEVLQPGILEPVYGVTIESLDWPQGHRPVLAVRHAADPLR